MQDVLVSADESSCLNTMLSRSYRILCIISINL